MIELLKCIKQIIIRSMKYRNRKGLKKRGFTILSNNCVGGYVYQYFGLPYKSPTVGVLLCANDFLKLCKRPEYYLSKPLVFIPKDIAHGAELVKTMGRWGEYPVGRIEDIDLYFMHYATPEEALNKWTRRCRRVNYHNLILLLAENETVTTDIVDEFCSLPNKNKICLVHNQYNIKGAIYSEKTHLNAKKHWRPEEVLKLVEWKTYLNNIEENECDS